jgi:transcription elongation factor Elf1
VGGRKRRKLVPVRQKPKLPKTFECPRCGKVSIAIKIKDGIGKVNCGSCGLSTEIEVPPVFGQVDVYGRFIDLYTEGKVEISGGEKIEDEGESE